MDRTQAAPRAPLHSIVLGPTQIVKSSLSSSWPSILLERHLYSPGERTAASIDKHVLSVVHGAPARFDYRNVNGVFLSATLRPKSIMITPQGAVPDVRLHTSADFSHCAFDDAFLRNVADELEHASHRPIFRLGIEDKASERIVGMLLDELEAKSPTSRHYLESLAYALATRYLLLGTKASLPSKSRLPGLVPRVLNRVRETIEANLEENLNVEDLAKDSGYSRAHFIRIFRTATGFTPHQYVLNLRLCRAQEHLRHPNSSLVDVASSCGFASQSHMASVFRRHLAITPGEFRRLSGVKTCKDGELKRQILESKNRRSER